VSLRVGFVLRGAQRRLCLYRREHPDGGPAYERIIFSVPLEPACFAARCYRTGLRPRTRAKYQRAGFSEAELRSRGRT
jgi:hypothetical protein